MQRPVQFREELLHRASDSIIPSFHCWNHVVRRTNDDIELLGVDMRVDSTDLLCILVEMNLSIDIWIVPIQEDVIYVLNHRSVVHLLIINIAIDVECKMMLTTSHENVLFQTVQELCGPLVCWELDEESHSSAIFLSWSAISD